MYTNDSNYTVIIHCMTFNHKPYIRQCLDGFVMQKTKFPFIAIVVDDASTDNEQEVLWDFINSELDSTFLQKDETDDLVKVVATHKTNNNCTFIFLFLKYNHYNIKKDKRIYLKPWEEKTKYIAICEGDDYWIDPLKLQKQVDILERHQNITMIHSGFKYLDDNSCSFRDSSPVNSNISNIEKIYNILNYNKYRIQTCTVVVRRDCWDKTIDINKEVFNPHYFLMGDTQRWVGLLEIGDIYYLPDITSVYRIHSNSATCRNNNSVRKLRFDLSCSEMRLFFIEKLKLSETFKKEIENVYYHQLIKYKVFNPDYIPYHKIDKKHALILKLTTIPIVRKFLKFYLTNKKGIKEF